MAQLLHCNPCRLHFHYSSNDYPNPARDVLHVQLPEGGRSRLIVFNHGWIPVREREADDRDVTLDLRSLSPGVYYLLVLQDGKRYSATFVIQ